LVNYSSRHYILPIGY